MTTQYRIKPLQMAMLLASFAAGTVKAQDNILETIIVTSERQETALQDIPASIYSLGSDTLEMIKHVHIGEVLNSVPGVVFNRGNGQESLLGIRSPVLTGAGSCGAFQTSQDGIPLRGAGFCNVNQLFEANSEQAGNIEIVRGPGSVLFGVNALHGAINVISPTLGGESEGDVSLDIGPNEYARLNVGLNGKYDDHSFGAYFNGASDGGYLDDSGFDQQKLNLSHRYTGSEVTVTTVMAATNLNQETAGYLDGGFEAFKNDDLNRTNGNPEAFRDAQSFRLHSRIEGSTDNGSWVLTPYYRDTDMTFLMHFLPGAPLEENGHESFGLQSMYSSGGNGPLTWTAGVDFEFSEGFLKQSQGFGFGSFPSGKQYDYSVDTQMVSPYVLMEYQSSDQDQLTLGLRYEFLEYDYNNQMINGNTAEDGSSCSPSAFNPSGTCRYSRPGDRTDDFDNYSLQLGWIHDIEANVQLFTNVSLAFRAPQATELYRLQQNQQVADLESEEMESFEVGYRASRGNLSYTLAAYYMKKDNVIFQDSGRRNVDNGETKHRGLEFNTLLNMNEAWSLSVTASYARHTYEANVAPRGVTVILDGNDINTAPKLTGNAKLNWQINANSNLNLEWVHMGPYYTNESNTHKYKGHDLLNMRYQYDSTNNWYVSARITNLLDTDYAERARFNAFSDFSGDEYFVGQKRGLYLSVGSRF
ncbi:MAG: TonB-dependent receptor [Gammaproteobacteria bacterium]|nr:TonB-dependent receptor [Gammaproteobacteria bacterium]